MKKKCVSILLAAALMLIALPQVFAQAGFDDDVNDTPLDGGLGALAAVGIAYSAKKLKDRKAKINK